MDTGAGAVVWESGKAYEGYIGRWSRLVAREFLAWLDLGPEQRWLDVGCGTGVLTRSILELSAPREVIGVDPSEAFLSLAQEEPTDARAQFQAGDAGALPFEIGTFDVVVSGLVLNFVADPAVGLIEMKRVVRRGGAVAAYVWDYAGEMQLLRYFWDAAVALDPAAAELDEGRFAICHPEALQALFEQAGLARVAVRPIDVPTRFHDFDDYWLPFLAGQGPAGAYAVKLSGARREALQERLRAVLPTAGDGSIPLHARAWAVRGER